MRVPSAMTPADPRPAMPSFETFDVRSAMDALADAIIVIAPDWRVRYLNAPWERILSVRADQAVGQDFWETYPGLGAEPGGAMIRATAADGSTRRFDLEIWIASELRSYGVRVARDDGGCVVVALRSEEHTSELQSLAYLVCRLLLEKKK